METVKNFMTYDFKITELSVAVYVPAGGGDSVHKNRRFHGIVYNQSGVKNYLFDNNKTVIVREKEVLYLPKNSNYIVDIIEPGGCYAINFDFEDNIHEEAFSYKVKNPSAVQELFVKAENEYRMKKAGCNMRCKAALYNILAEIQTEYNLEYISDSKFSIIAPAVEYIGEHYAYEIISIKDLAEMCGISDVYFRKIFLNKVGMPPLKYINMLKINRAKSLLDTGMYSVQKTAELSGFINECYFSREFKKRIGVSPLMYMSKQNQL